MIIYEANKITKHHREQKPEAKNCRAQKNR